MSILENKRQARRLYEEVFGRGNLAAADEILAPDCISHGPGVPPTSGTDGIKAQAERLRTAFPDLRTILNDQLAEDDRVASRWTGTGTFTKRLAIPSLPPLEPGGQTITWDEIRIDRFANGRIVESWFIPDRMGLFQQMGLFPAGR